MALVNPFDRITQLLKTSNCSEVLILLLNDSGNRIIPPYNSDLNHAWYLVGCAFYKQERYSNALKAFKNSYRHWTEDVDAIRAIGNCYSELRNPKTAKYYFIKAISIGGNYYKGADILTYNLGNTYFDMKKYLQAITEYKKVRKSDLKTYRLAQKNIIHAKDRMGKSRKGIM